MPLKLGELLINERMITPAQLEEALRQHVIYGIKLGSSLVELGFVTEDQLAALLSAKLKVPRVDRREVLAAPPDVIGLIGRELAGSHRMIPYRLEKNRLSVAMSDPTNFRGIDEVGFVTGKQIKVHITPDVVISRALARFYNFSVAESRYHQLALKENLRKAPPGAQAVPTPAASGGGTLLQITVPAESDGLGSFDGNAAGHGAAATAGAAAVTPEQGPQPSYSVDQVAIDFAAVNSREELADVFIRYLGMDFEVGGLFVVHGTDAVGWRGIFKGNRLPAFEQLNIDLTRASILKEVLESRRFFMGVLSDNPCNRQILFMLKSSADTLLLVLPVIMMDEVVAVVIVSVYEKNFRWRLMELENLVRKMSLVFEKLIIKHKILMT